MRHSHIWNQYAQLDKIIPVTLIPLRQAHSSHATHRSHLGRWVLLSCPESRQYACHRLSTKEDQRGHS